MHHVFENAHVRICIAFIEIGLMLFCPANYVYFTSTCFLITYVSFLLYNVFNLFLSSAILLAVLLKSDTIRRIFYLSCLNTTRVSPFLSVFPEVPRFFCMLHVSHRFIFNNFISNGKGEKLNTKSFFSPQLLIS